MCGVITALVAGAGASLLLSAAAPAAEIVVQEGDDTLHAAVAAAAPGDTLVLQPGFYLLTHTVVIDKDLTIKGATRKREDVHIVGAGADEFNLEPEKFESPLDWGHLLFVTSGAAKVSFSYFTIKSAPEIEAITEDFCEANFGLNHTECFGDAIHAAGVGVIQVQSIEASLNGGNGIWVDGANQAIFRDILAVNNGAFGIDVDTALDLSIRDSTFTANQVSGVEASGHEPGIPRAEYVANVTIKNVVAKGNGEIGVEVERFLKATIESLTCADNREDGFDADRVGAVALTRSRFVNNLDDGIELFPVGVAPEEQPADFPGSITETFSRLVFSGNGGEEINHAPTEN
jgi:hypothetical protein